MALFGRNWINDPTPEEKFEAITGYQAEDNLKKEVEERIESPWISNSERKKLQELNQYLESLL